MCQLWQLFDPYAKQMNLQFDHKIYPKSKSMGNSALFQIKKLTNQVVDPNEQFMLLCRICHMALTYLRINREKAKHVVELANKLGILEPPNSI